MTVYKWIGRFDEEGPEGLYDQEREGRPPKLDKEAETEIERVLEEMIGRHQRIETVLLPRRSPEDNPGEDLWRQLKSTVAANLERSLAALKEACREFFDELTPEEALRMAGLR